MDYCAMTSPIVLSHFQAQSLLAARQAGEATPLVSLDLTLSQIPVTWDESGVHLPGAQCLPWPTIAVLADDENSCFLIEAGEAEKIQRFSEENNRHYSLYPTASAPTLLISGISMHRIKESDPHQDTLAKVSTVKPLTGRVLDTTTGLGYTAIQAAKTADHVITVEFDPAVLEVARCNPWSQALFDNPKIEQRIGDSDDVIRTFPDASFDRIIHDPPMFSLAGHLYGADFYRELYRVLARRGRLFHYIANPDSKSGATITRGVMRRLEEVGFQRIERRPQAFGVVAYK
ncbi:MAG: methyltransferase domain-containing protein [Caldilineaceae bacterium]|nr:methyltransferase domain-containing protein [Caldilineaceae bacterium]